MAKNIKNKIDLKTPDELVNQIVGEFVDEISKLTIRLITEEEIECYEDAVKTRDLITQTIKQTKLILEALSEVQIGEQLLNETQYISEQIRKEFKKFIK